MHTTKLVEDIYPLSPTQEGILLHSSYSDGSPFYVLQYCWRLEGIDPGSMRAAWQEVTRRHTILRTAFSWKQSTRPFQVVGREVAVRITEADWRALAAPQQVQQLNSFLQTDRDRGFDLSKAPLMRWVLFQISDREYYFVWTFHHILLDGWSASLVIGEVFEIYQAIRAERPRHLGDARPYGEYIRWLQQQDLAEAEKFWRRTLEGTPVATRIALQQGDGTKAASVNDYADYQITISAENTRALYDVVRRHHLTLSTVVQAAWAATLFRQSRSLDVMFGIAVSGRPVKLAGVESMAGVFVNVLPARIKAARDTSLIPWLKQLHFARAESGEYECTPLLRSWNGAACHVRERCLRVYLLLIVFP